LNTSKRGIYKKKSPTQKSSNKDFSELRKDFYGGMKMKNQNKLVTSLNCLR